MPHLSVASSARCAAIGNWRLHPGHAMSLIPKKTAVLRVFCGQVWVTLSDSGGAVPVHAGDHFLGPGDVLVVPPLSRLVMEPVTLPGDSGPVHFDWSDATTAPVPGRFAREVAAPAREVGVSLGRAVWALSRMLRGLLGYSEFLVARRGQAPRVGETGLW